MHIILIDYVADLARIDETLQAHRAWLDEHYRSGLFLASGRREPRVGGVIIAVGDRQVVAKAVSGDPFATRGLARHSVIEFHPSRFGGVLDSADVIAALTRC